MRKATSKSRLLSRLAFHPGDIEVKTSESQHRKVSTPGASKAPASEDPKRLGDFEVITSESHMTEGIPQAPQKSKLRRRQNS